MTSLNFSLKELSALEAVKIPPFDEACPYGLRVYFLSDFKVLCAFWWGSVMFEFGQRAFIKSLICPKTNNCPRRRDETCQDAQ